MPRVKTTSPVPSRHKNQRAETSDPLFLTRYLPNWSRPNWIEANAWRRLVESQPICVLCQERQISSMLALDWKIEPRDSTLRDELKDDIKYYTKFFEETVDYEYSELIEWLGADYFTLPFGGAAEVGRQGDDEDGKVLWLELLDGGTMFPTLNFDYPYGQSVAGVQDRVYFPKHSINRIYMSPHTQIQRKGWGVASPEKIYFAMQLISRGDVYYANLLLDTPEAGILDLMDMSKNSAENWVEAWRKMLTGIDPYKIPVLYEHTQKAEFIPFTRNPTDISFTESISRYTSLICSGYGMAPTDIGIGSSEALAGSIRDERRYKQNGFARFKLKMTSFFNRLLPSTMRFKFIDLDDEVAVSVGRARLAQATAAQAYVNGNIFTQEEMRAQAVADGLITISVPEALPQELKDKIEQKEQMFNPSNKTPERPSMLGRPVTPSTGGWGETAARSDVFRSTVLGILNSDDKYFRRLLYLAYPPVSLDVKGAITTLEGQDQVASWVDAYNEALWFRVGGNDLSELTSIVVDSTFDSLVSEANTMELLPQSFVEQIIKEAHVVAEEIGRDLALRSKERSFVVGDTKFKDDNIVVSLDNLALENLLASYRNDVSKALAKCAISTVRDIMLENLNNDIEYVVFGQRSLDEMKERANTVLNQIANEFSDAVSGIIIDAIRSKEDATEGLEESSI